MTHMRDDVNALVRRFGGLSAMARALGHAHPTTVQGWRDRGTIPRWRIYEIRQSKLGQTDAEIAGLLDRLDPRDPVGCRYIAGDPKGAWSYCNRPQKPGSAYCAEHHALCRVPADDADALAEIERAAACGDRPERG
jgi:hypothetical protein